MEFVRDYMTAAVETLESTSTLRDAVRLEMQRKIRHIPIVRDGHLVGFVTDRDLKRAMPSVLAAVDRTEHERILGETQLGQIMTRDPDTIASTAPLRSAVEVMLNKKYGALPVVDNGKLVGIISETDLLRALLHHIDVHNKL